METFRAQCDPGVAGAVVREINGAISGNVATRDDLEKLQIRFEARFETMEARIWKVVVAAVVAGVGLMKLLDYLLPGA